MFLSTYVRHPVIRNFVKEVPSGQVLFSQGEQGSTMFLILDGIIQLMDEAEDGRHLVGTFGPGQFFGEKTLLKSPIQRFFTAQSMTKSLVMEFTQGDLSEIQKVIPDFMIHMFQSGAQRLERAYALIRILQTSDDATKLVHSILYFYRSPGLDSAAGKFIPLAAEDLQHLLNAMDGNYIKYCLQQLVNLKVLTRQTDGTFLLADERALILAISELTQKAAA